MGYWDTFHRGNGRLWGPQDRASPNGRIERRSTDGFEPRSHLSPSHRGGLEYQGLVASRADTSLIVLGLWDWAAESTWLSTPFSDVYSRLGHAKSRMNSPNQFRLPCEV